MYQRIAVTFGSGCMQEFRTILPREFKQIAGPHGTNHEGFYTETKIVHRTGRGRKVENVVDLSRVEFLADVLLKEFKSRFVTNLLEISQRSSAEIINPENGVSFCQ